MSKVYIGIDLGGTNIAIGLVNEACQLLDKGSVPTGRERTCAEIMRDAAGLTSVLLERNGMDPSQVCVIGVGAPGFVDPKKRIIFEEVNFPAFKNENLEEELGQYFPGIPVYLENDANAAAFGEAICGAVQGISDAVVVTLGTGVGGGIIMNGKIYSGFNAGASELGHMVIDLNGPLCACGRRGCYENYASATALICQTKEKIEAYPDSIIHEMIGHNPDNITGKTAFDAAKQGDPAGQQIVSEYIEYLGMGVVNLINMLQPEAIVIGGGICKEGDYLLSRLQAFVDQFSYTPEGVPKTKLLTAALGNDAGIIGAAMLWKQEV